MYKLLKPNWPMILPNVVPTFMKPWRLEEMLYHKVDTVALLSQAVEDNEDKMCNHLTSWNCYPTHFCSIPNLTLNSLIISIIVNCYHPVDAHCLSVIYNCCFFIDKLLLAGLASFTGPLTVRRDAACKPIKHATLQTSISRHYHNTNCESGQPSGSSDITLKVHWSQSICNTSLPTSTSYPPLGSTVTCSHHSCTQPPLLHTAIYVLQPGLTVNSMIHV